MNVLPMATHLIVDAKASRNLSEKGAIEAWMRSIVAMTGMHELAHMIFRLETHYDSGPGITDVLVITESHIALHTWPEHKVVTFDMYSCRPYDPRPVWASFNTMFGVTKVLKNGPYFIDRWTEADEDEHA